jgi:toxin ParE1/3/4
MSHASYKIRFLRVAEDDFTEIILYIAADRPSAATKIADRIEQKLKLLSDNPHLGSVPTDDSFAQLGYRYLVVDSYLIFYVIEEEVIYVHRIAHGARDYTQLL